MSSGVLLGYQHFSPKSPVYWDPAQAISGHALLVGSSGTGKTYRLNMLLQGISEQHPGARFHIIDSQKDIDIDNPNRTVFGESQPFGINPLDVHTDPDFGGVRRRINSFIWMINTYSTKLGINQETAMRHMLEELYFLNGYDAKKAETWNPRTNPNVRGRSAQTGRHPSISDLEVLCMRRMREVLTGTRGESIKALDDLSREVAKLAKQRIASAGGDFDEDALDAKRKKAITAFTDYVNKMETGTEFSDYLRFSDFATMKSILSRIQSLNAAGIFKDAPPVFNQSNPSFIYDIAALSEQEQRMFADVLLERIFLEARSRGITSKPRTFIVIDEAHKFLQDDAEHILNRISREARKFGVGMILVSQSFDHFPDDIIANSAMTVILGIHPMQQDRLERRLSLPKGKLKHIRAQSTALIQIRTASTIAHSGKFEDIDLAQIRSA